MGSARTAARFTRGENMTEKTKRNKKQYVLATEHNRMENGRLIRKGEQVDVSKLSQADIDTLVRIGIYKEVKNA
jgi:hypothetical protein